MLRIIAIPLVAVGLILGGLALRQARGEATTEFRLPVGHEQPRPGTQAIFENGFNIPNLSDCALAQSYAVTKIMTGPPIAPFDGQSMNFLYAKLRCVPSASGATVVWEDLGATDMRINGRVPQPGSEPAQPVREHLVNSLQTGVDPAQVFGRIISQPVCDGHHECCQYTDKQKLLYREGDLGTAVRWAPLGCTLSHLCIAQTQSASGVNLPLLVLGGAAVLLGLGLFIAGRRSGGFAPALM